MATNYYYIPASAFPSTKTASINKLITENSLTRMINRLLDVDGYVITKQLDDSDIGVDINQDIPIQNFENDFEFVIWGYYFNIGNINNLLDAVGWEDAKAEWTGDSVGHLTARIFINNSLAGYPELFGQDLVEQGDNPPYKALQFFITKDDEQVDPEPPDGAALESYKYYDLEIAAYGKTGGSTEKITYVPISSLHKFSSKSLMSVDGGEIIF